MVAGPPEAGGGARSERALWTSLFDALAGSWDDLGRWMTAVEQFLDADPPVAPLRWLGEQDEPADGALVGALFRTGAELLEQTTLDAVPRLLRLDALALTISCQALGDDSVTTDLLMTVLQQVEVKGCGPRNPTDDPDRALMRAFNYRGCSLAEGLQFEPAREHFTACLELEPRFAPAYCNRIRMNLELGHQAAVDDDCATLRELDPGYSVAAGTLHLVDALRRLAPYEPGDPTPTEVAFENGLLEHLRTYDRPGRPFEQGCTLLELRDPFALDPLPAQPSVEDLNHRGVVLGRSGRIDEAVEAFTAGIALDPTYDRLLLNRGNALRMLGRLDEALADLTGYVGRVPGDAVGFRLRARVLRSLGRDDEAQADERAEELWSPRREE